MIDEGPPASISVYGQVPQQVNEHDLHEAFPYLKLAVRKGESRGFGQEVLLFVLQTDWSVVRDTLVATAIAKGALDTRTAISAASKRVAASFSSLKAKSDGGAIVLEDSKTRLHLTISGKAAQSEAPWLALFGTDAKGSMVWDETTEEWKAGD